MVDAPKPEMGHNDLLIKIRKTAICGTDVHIYNWMSGHKRPSRFLWLSAMNMSAKWWIWVRKFVASILVTECQAKVISPVVTAVIAVVAVLICAVTQWGLGLTAKAPSPNIW